MRIRIFSILSVVCMAVQTLAQPATGYYTSSTLDGKNGRDLELALAAIVMNSTFTHVSYDNLWEKFETTDKMPPELLTDNTKTDQVYDMYASWTEFPKYYSAHNGETSAQLHSQTGGINREHSVPNSWWGGKSGNTNAYSDLHHLTPADGAANNAKGDNPLGQYAAGFTMAWPTETRTATMGNNTAYTYMRADNTADHTGSWSHVWNVPFAQRANYGGADQIWEPADEFKGDFARMYMYVVCAYEGQLMWNTQYMFESDANRLTTIKPWAKELLLQWHRQDRVSDKERARNNAVYGIQNNRNPFIDYPELAEYIWGDKQGEQFALANALSSYSEDYINGTAGEGGESGGEPAEEAKTAPQLYYPFIAHVGQPFAAPELTTDSDGAFTYVSSHPEVASVDPTTGRVTIHAVGTTIITVTQAATSRYASGTASYMIKVVE